jgi:hypothetical protein
MEWLLEREGGKALGRLVEVRNVDLALLRGGVTIWDLRIGPPLPQDGTKPAVGAEQTILGWARLSANLDWLGLLNKSIHLRELELVEPRVQLEVSQDGSVTRLRIAAPDPEATDESSGEEEAAEPWSVRIDALTCRESNLRLLRERNRAIAEVALTLEEFSVGDLAVQGGEVSLGRIGIRRPRIRVRRDLSLGGGASEPAQVKPSEAPRARGAGTPPGFRVSELEIDRAEFTLLTDEAALDVAFRFSARDVNVAKGDPFPVDLELNIEGGSLRVEGQARVVPPFFDGSLQWSELPLPQILEVAEAKLPIELQSGRAQGDLRVSFGNADVDAEAPARVDLAGRVLVQDFAATAPDAGAKVAWTSLELNADEIVVPIGSAEEPVRVRLAKLDWRQPVLRLRRSAKEKPEPPEEVSASQASEPSKPPSVELGALAISDGSVEFVDESVSPPVEARVQDILISGSKLCWPQRDVPRIKYSSQGPGAASLAVAGGMQGGSGRFDLDLQRLRLPLLDPYLMDALGQGIQKGGLTLRSHVGIEEDRIAARNELVLHQLQLSNAESDEFEKRFGMSLSLALALLRDQEGNISLEPSVIVERGAVHLGPIIREALREALRGALRSPLKAIGMVAGASGSEAQVHALAMEAGTMRLVSSEGPGLASIAELLASRPSLMLTLRGRSDHSDDVAIAEQMLMESAEAGRELPPLEDVGFFARRRIQNALVARARGESGELEPEDQRTLERWIAAVKVPEARRQALAQARATRLRQELVRAHEADPRRLSVGEPEPGTPAVVLELGAVREAALAP